MGQTKSSLAAAGSDPSQPENQDFPGGIRDESNFDPIIFYITSKTETTFTPTSPAMRKSEDTYFQRGVWKFSKKSKKSFSAILKAHEPNAMYRNIPSEIIQYCELCLEFTNPESRKAREAFIHTFHYNHIALPLMYAWVKGRTPMLVMELFQGSINHFIGKLLPDQLTKCFVDILGAIHWIHTRNLIHGDIKPENICTNDSLSRFYLIDFDLTKPYKTKTGIHCEYEIFVEPPVWSEFDEDGAGTVQVTPPEEENLLAPTTAHFSPYEGFGSENPIPPQPDTIPDSAIRNFGTLLYSSVDQMSLVSMSRRTDMQSLVYTMLRLIATVLPWSEQDAANQASEVRNLKRSHLPIQDAESSYTQDATTPFASKLLLACNITPVSSPYYVVLQQFISNIFTLSFTAEPDYATLLSYLHAPITTQQQQ